MMISKLKTTLIAAIAVSFAAVPVVATASGDAAKQRQELMSHVGAATKAGAGIAKGETEFDVVTAQLVMRTMNSAGLAFGYMFPEGSETGSKTEAAPAIWSDRAGFDAAVNKFAADTSATVTDLESFKAAFGAATANCGSCHKAYRVKN